MLTFGGGLGAVQPPRTQFQTPKIVGTITRININHASPFSSLSVTGHNSPSGHVFVLLCSRNTVNSPQGWDGATWGGDAMTQICDVVSTISGSKAQTATVWAGYKYAGLTGSQTVVITPTAAEYLDACGFIFSVDRMLPSSPLGASSGGSVVRAVQSAYGRAISAGNSGSLLVSLVAACDEDLSPFAIPTGWTLNDQMKTGNAGPGDIAGVLGSRVAGAVASFTMTATSTATGTPTTDDWGAVSIEILPA